MKSMIFGWLASAVAMLLCDSVWLGTMSTRLYRPLLGPILRPDFDPWAAAAFYLIYVSGVLGFAVWPALGSASALSPAVRGALFGLCAYATYDLTNQATLKDWPLRITLADLAWGMVITAITATAGWWAARQS